MKGLNELMDMLEENLKRMIQALETGEDALWDEAVALEAKIDALRTKLKERTEEEADRQKYSYAAASMYSYIVSECERLGDYVMNVFEAKLDHREKNLAI